MSRLEQAIAIIETLSTDNPEQAKAALRAAIPILVDLSPTELLDIFEQIKAKTSLPKAWLRALAEEVKAARKQARTGGRSDNGGPTYTAMLPDLVDLVESEGAPAFLMLTETDPVITPEWQHDGQICVPPPREQIPWLLPRGKEVLRWFAAKEPADRLYHDLLCYFRGVAELPGEGFYDLLTAWTFHSHLLEPVQYSPELCLYAVPERGKTRTGKAAIYVARRGVHVESLRDAYLVRLANNFQATVFFDVMNLWKKAEKAGSEDILLGRFERGIKVPRVLFPDRGPHRDTVFFDIFGPTIIATNVAVHDILDSRGSKLTCPKPPVRSMATSPRRPPC